MKITKLTIIPVIIATLMLAGCGGGGSSTPAKQPGKITVTNKGIT